MKSVMKQDFLEKETTFFSSLELPWDLVTSLYLYVWRYTSSMKVYLFIPLVCFFIPFWWGLLGPFTIQGITDISVVMAIILVNIFRDVWHLIWNVLYIWNLGANVFKDMETEAESLSELDQGWQNGRSQWLVLMHKDCSLYLSHCFTQPHDTPCTAPN